MAKRLHTRKKIRGGNISPKKRREENESEKCKSRHHKLVLLVSGILLIF